MPLQVHRPAGTVLLRPAATALRPGQMTRVDPAAQEGPVRVDPAGPAVLVSTARVVPAGQADPADPDPVVLVTPDTRVDPASTVPAGPVDLVVPAVRVDQADRAVHGTGMLSVATSTEPRGEKDPLLGATVSRPGQRGTDRSHRRGVTGITARSIIGATRKHPCGIPDSTSGASTSSESGSRCKSLTQPTTTPVSPLGETGVVLTARPGTARWPGTLYTSRVKLRMTVGVCALVKSL